MTDEHEEHVQRRLADGWYAVHTCQECKREFNSPGEAVATKPLSSEQTAKLVYDTCCEYFGPGHEEHSIPIIAQAIREARAEVLAACLGRLGDLVISRQDAATQAGRDDKERLRQVFLDERDGLKAAVVALKELQPAASDLEALLLHRIREKFNRVCKFCASEFLHYSKTDICCQCRTEALLREAELKGRWAQHACERHGDGEGREFFCDECKHLTELEKARASEGASK